MKKKSQNQKLDEILEIERKRWVLEKTATIIYAGAILVYGILNNYSSLGNAYQQIKSAVVQEIKDSTKYTDWRVSLYP